MCIIRHAIQVKRWLTLKIDWLADYHPFNRMRSPIKGQMCQFVLQQWIINFAFMNSLWASMKQWYRHASTNVWYIIYPRNKCKRFRAWSCLYEVFILKFHMKKRSHFATLCIPNYIVYFIYWFFFYTCFISKVKVSSDYWRRLAAEVWKKHANQLKKRKPGTMLMMMSTSICDHNVVKPSPAWT